MLYGEVTATEKNISEKKARFEVYLSALCRTNNTK